MRIDFQGKHQHLLSTPAAVVPKRYVELASVPGNKITRDDVRHLIVGESLLNLSAKHQTFPLNLFATWDQVEITGWVEDILESKEDILYYTVERACWALFNVEGSLMGFVWWVPDRNPLQDAAGHLFALVADYDELFAEIRRAFVEVQVE